MKNIPPKLKDWMKIGIVCGLLLPILIPVISSAQVSTNYWKLASGFLTPILSSWTLQVSNQSSDPTGTNGAIYYNTGTNLFRCYQNGIWTNCIFNGGLGNQAGTWSTTTSQTAGHLINYPNNATDVVTIGASATTTSPYYFDPNLPRAFIKYASSTGITSDMLTVGSSTFTEATTTSLAITNISSGLIKVNAQGSVQKATAGTDYDIFPWMFGSVNIYGQTAISTTTALSIQGGYFSSSTAASQLPYASSTAATIGNLFATNVTLSNPLSISSGGTNASSFTTAGNGVYFDGTSLLTEPANAPVTHPYASSTAITAGAIFGSGLTTCSLGTVLQWVNGVFNCTGIPGGGGGSSTWATTTSQTPNILVNYSSRNTDVVTIGSNSTTSASFYFDPNTATAFMGTSTAGNSTVTLGSTGNEWSIGENTNGNVFEISSSTTLGTNDGLKIDKNLLVTMPGGLDAQATSTFEGAILLQGWGLSTSTVACPDGQSVGCQFAGPDSILKAWQAGYKNVQMKEGTYTITQPQLFTQSGTTLIGRGDASVISYNGTSIKVAIMSGNLGAELSNLAFRDFRVNETGAGGRSTCMDTSRIVTSVIDHVHCDKHKIGFIASTSQSYYNTYSNDDVTHLTSTNGVLDSFGFYFGDNGSGDGGPIDNTFINLHVSNFVNGSSTSYYFNSHSEVGISLDSEGGYIGMHLGSLASDSNLKVYLEANKIGLMMDGSQAQIGSVNITGNISDSNLTGANQASYDANNIIDNGVAGLCINARVQYAAVNYCTNVKQGFGTKTPDTPLEVSNEVETSTPGIPNNTPGLFGGRGTAFGISFKSGNSVSERYLVNDIISNNFPLLDIVVATDTESGMRIVRESHLGTQDTFSLLETTVGGYGVYSSQASSTLGINQGTALASVQSDVLLAPNENKTQFRVTYPNGYVGVGTTTPFARLSIQNYLGSPATTLFAIGSSTSVSGTTTLFSISNTGSTTAANGFNITGGCYAVNGACITAGGGGAVSSVSNSDGTLSVSPTTGTVVAGLNLGHANTWLGLQTFTNASSTLFSSTYASSTRGIFGTVTLGNTKGVSGNCLHADINGVISGVGSDCGTSAVNTISNSDGSLTISPTTGDIVASLNPGHTNYWTAFQSFTNATFANASSTNATSTFLVSTNFTTGNASTSLLSVSGGAWFGSANQAIFDSNGALSLGYATTTEAFGVTKIQNIAGSALNILTTDSAAAGTAANAITMTGGIGSTTAAGGAITLTTGKGGSTGNGGKLTLAAGNSGDTNGGGGNVEIDGGDSVSASNFQGGEIRMLGGDSSGNAAGGQAVWIGGAGGSTGSGGPMSLIGGAGGSTSGDGGQISIYGGNATAGSSNGGDILIAPGVLSGGGSDGVIHFRQNRSSVNQANFDLSLISTSDKTFQFPNWSGIFAVATGTLQAPAFVATSTTATSTIAGGMTMTRGQGKNMLSIIPAGNIGTSNANIGEGALIVDNTNNTLSPGLYVSSDQAGVPSNPLAIIRSTSASYNQGLLWLLGSSANTGGAAYGLKIQDGNPDIEFNESDQTNPAGEYEIDVNNDLLRFNGRNTADNSFDTMAWFSRMDKTNTGAGIRFCLGCGFTDLPSSTFNIVGTTSEKLPYFSVSSASTSRATGDRFVVAGNSTAGVGSTTPWATFSVVASSTDSNPLIAVATSTSNSTIFSIFGTTSIQALGSTAINASNPDIGVRVGIGTNSYHGYGGLLDQLTVRGRINTEGWNEVACDLGSGLGSGAATSNLCASFQVAVAGGILTNALSNSSGGTGSGYAYAAVSMPTINVNGVGSFYEAGGVSGGTTWVGLATDTPVMEMNARIHSPQNSTSTSYVIGFTGNVSSITWPTTGCFFNASSSASTGNWWAVAANGGSYTLIDTGVASSTNVTSTGGWRKFRIEADANHCAFYIQNSESSPLAQVANITTNIPTAGVKSHIWIANTASTTVNAFDFNHFRLWWRDVLPAL